MPVEAFVCGGEFGDDVGGAKLDPFARKPAFGQRADEEIFFGNAKRGDEDAQFVDVARVGWRFRGADGDMEAEGNEFADTVDRLRPDAGTRRRTVALSAARLPHAL